MAVAHIFAAQPSVLAGEIVTVEADLSRGLHSFSVVGLAGKAVEEARDRVSASIKNSGFPSPKSKNHKITISLAPADIKKEGPRFDLAIALAYLKSADAYVGETDQTLFLGELALTGMLRPVHGVLPCVRAAKERGYTSVIVPKVNAAEAALVNGITVYGAESLIEVIDHLDRNREHHTPIPQTTPTPYKTKISKDSVIGFDDIRGQETAKRGLIIAAAGRHNVIMVGPPGTGKTMLARAFQHILPPLEQDEALDVTAIHSVTGTLSETIMYTPPFRTPHHTASHVSLVGGGTHPKPGEVTLAHRGVLFLILVPQFY